MLGIIKMFIDFPGLVELIKLIYGVKVVEVKMEKKLVPGAVEGVTEGVAANIIENINEMENILQADIDQGTFCDSEDSDTSDNSWEAVKHRDQENDDTTLMEENAGRQN